MFLMLLLKKPWKQAWFWNASAVGQRSKGPVLTSTPSYNKAKIQMKSHGDAQTQ